MVIVIYVVAQQCITEESTQIPYRNVEGSLGFRGGNLAEIVVPPIMIGMQMLCGLVWFLETCLKVEIKVQRTVPVPSERIEVD